MVHCTTEFLKSAMHPLSNTVTCGTAGIHTNDLVCSLGKEPKIRWIPAHNLPLGLAPPLGLSLKLSPCPRALGPGHNFKPRLRSSAATYMEDEFGNYDVFLSHRGLDTKTGFVSFLYDCLVDAGLRPFLDRKSIGEGEDCWRSVEHAIKTSPIALVIFSKNFAGFSWCLNELHVMLESPSVKVLPIFYKVQPSELRHLEKGQLAAGFKKLQSLFNNTIIE